MDAARGLVGLPVPELPQGAGSLVLVGAPGCHLCELAAVEVQAAAEQVGCAWQELSVADYPDLRQRFADFIPVVVVFGRVQAVYRARQKQIVEALQVEHLDSSTNFRA